MVTFYTLIHKCPKVFGFRNKIGIDLTYSVFFYSICTFYQPKQKEIKSLFIVNNEMFCNEFRNRSDTYDFNYKAHERDS